MTTTKRLRKLDKIVDIKRKELDKLNYNKYSWLFNEAARFLAPRKALMYGGLAIDELLPPHLKIYEPDTLPDIDVLSPEAKKLASGLVDYYKNMKHDAVSFTEALHPGTYKVFVGGVQVADITQCSDNTYKKFLKNSTVSSNLKIKIVPSQFLRMTLHKLMSQPNDAHRWNNVYNRLIKFYKVFPPTKCELKDLTNVPFENTIITKDIYTALEGLPCVFFGKKELSLILGKKVGDYTGLPPIQILIDSNIKEFATDLVSKVPSLHRSKVHPKDDVMAPHTFLYHDNKPYVGIYRVNNCVAYNLYRKQKIANINTILDLYLTMILSPNPEFKKMRGTLDCLVNVLTRVQQKALRSRKILHQQFATDCFGPTVGVVTLRRQRVKRLMRNKKNKSNFTKDQIK